MERVLHGVEETIFIAVGKNFEKIKTTLFWALRSFVGKKICLLHVHRSPNVPTFHARKLPVCNLEHFDLKTFPPLERNRLQDILLQYSFFLAQQGVQAESVWIAMDNIEKGIVEIISQHNIRWLVMGAAADKYYSEKLSEPKSIKAMFVCQQAPTFCHIWFVCRGSLIYTRGGRNNEMEAEIMLPLEQLTPGPEPESPDYLTSEPAAQNCACRETEEDTNDLLERFNHQSPLLSSQLGCKLRGTPNSVMLLKHEEDKVEGRITKNIYRKPGIEVKDLENSRQELFAEEVKRWEEKNNAMMAKCKVKALESLSVKVMCLRKEMEESFAREKQDVAITRNQRDELMKEVQLVKNQKSLLESQLAESNLMVNELEEKIVSAVELLISFKEKRDATRIEYENALREITKLRRLSKMEPMTFYGSEILEFSFTEINEATHNFDPLRKIGDGRYGSIFKGFLRHASVAIKMLPSYGSQSQLEFQNGVEVLARVRHPNLLTLIGTCPESRSLVYDYARNGSLEDHLTCKDQTSALTWQTRINIAVQICSALIFLHSNKPCIIHGNLKPSKVLLDAKFVSKLSDFGIPHLLPQSRNMGSTIQTGNTFSQAYFSSYMDPEYLETGVLTPKSDVFSFGVILLQLLTGRPVSGIVHNVECALEKGNLKAVLDCSNGDWPPELARQLATLAMRCCQKRFSDRPDTVEIWGVLEKLKNSVTDFESCLRPKEPQQIPSHFVCPIFQEVMKDPQIAADGFTYDGEAIRGWLKSGHKTSPMTNLKLEHCNLLPNHALHQAIQEWQQHL